MIPGIKSKTELLEFINFVCYTTAQIESAWHENSVYASLGYPKSCLEFQHLSGKSLDNGDAFNFCNDKLQAMGMGYLYTQKRKEFFKEEYFVDEVMTKIRIGHIIDHMESSVKTEHQEAILQVWMEACREETDRAWYINVYCKNHCKNHS